MAEVVAHRYGGSALLLRSRPSAAAAREAGRHPLTAGSGCHLRAKPSVSDDASSAAVVLAAGLGHTIWRNTQADCAARPGKPILQHVLDALRAQAIAPVVVVVGHARDQVVRAISLSDEVVVVNRNPERGMLRSVLLGLRRLDEMWAVPERTLIALGDQPRLRRRADRWHCCRRHRTRKRPFVVPRYQDGRPGNPVLLEASGRTVAQQFVVHTRKDTDRGLSQLFARFPEAVRYVDVPGLNPDVDTPDELAALENRLVVGRLRRARRGLR
jgi:molybdenum cofactor cytidylyltransferase